MRKGNLRDREFVCILEVLCRLCSSLALVDVQFQNFWSVWSKVEPVQTARLHLEDVRGKRDMALETHVLRLNEGQAPSPVRREVTTKSATAPLCTFGKRVCCQKKTAIPLLTTGTVVHHSCNCLQLFTTSAKWSKCY